jgi:hypothetical protein
LDEAFFIPAADSPEQAQKVYDSIKQHLGDGLGAAFSNRRVARLRWRHDGVEYEAVVGQKTSFNGEVVVAILYEDLRRLYHVCTPSRGVIRGGSILAGSHDVLGATDFVPGA